MGRTKQTARRSTGGKAPRMSHSLAKSHRSCLTSEPNYESMTIAELKKLIPPNKIISSRPGKPPLKADIIESIRKCNLEKSNEPSTSGLEIEKTKIVKKSNENASEPKSREKKIKSTERKSKKSNEGMVILIWSKEDYELNKYIGGQTATYFSKSPFFKTVTYEQLGLSIDSLVKIFRHYLKSKSDENDYTDEDLVRNVVNNPSTQLHFNDNIYYYEATNAIFI